jgi:hypothetical protein
MQPQNHEEKVIWTCMVWTYGFYVLGALYVLAPVVGWLLVLRMVKARFRTRHDATSIPLPNVIWVWIIAILLMQFALLAGHIEFGLGLAATLKSSVGLAKGWALLPLFLLIGGAAIRPALMARAACIVCGQTLLLLPLLFLAFLAGLPQQLYVSPLSLIGGPGPEFFSVTLYGINPDNGLPRWRLFTPWAPALGFVANVYFFLALLERDWRWRAIGITGAVVMILVSGSRLGLVSIPVVLVLVVILTQWRHPALHFVAAFASLVAGAFFVHVTELFDSALERFHGARRDSSRVRALLGRIALDRWQKEAFVWGHGTVEPGPHLAEYMPIGSHHTWFGLLFVKGLLGFLALAVAMIWSLAVLIPRARQSETGRTGLSLLLVLLLYSFGENLEILAYLIWPALVFIGMAFHERSPVATPNATVESNTIIRSPA